MFSVMCPWCHGKFDYPKLEPGQEIKCPSCTRPVIVVGSPETGGFTLDRQEIKRKPEPGAHGERDDLE